jgi:dTDP-4-dehydrorhamnose 3,5-epimerase
MRVNEITPGWLASVQWKDPAPANIATIKGVVVKRLKVNVDGRGEVTELWSEPWTEQGFMVPAHCYQSATDFGVVKGLHLHEIHTDQFTVTRGKLQVVVADVRKESSTFGQVNCFFIGSLQPMLVKIPPLLLHGWKALTAPEVLVVNFQSHVYDANDEVRFAWDCVLGSVWEPKNG